MLVGLRTSFALGDGDAPMFTFGPRVRRGPLFAGADLHYMGRGTSYYPRAFAGSAVFGLQGAPALVGLAVTLVLVIGSSLTN